MTLTELKEQKQNLKTELLKVIESAETEKRSLNEAEQTLYDAKKKEIETIDSKIALKENELRNVRVTAPAQKFSILNAIKSVVENRSFNEVENEIVSAGREEMRKANLSVEGHISLPLNYRGAIQATVTAAGIENVPEDKLQLLTALRNKLVLINSGAQYLTGLVGTVSIPVYSGSMVGWQTEVGEAVDAGGTFSEVNYAPKRLTANLKISKQFLLQDSNDAENMLRVDLINAISEKLESTLLGNSAGSSMQPAGLGNLLTSTTVAEYADVIALEGSLEAANVQDYTYLLSPSLKASLRTMPKAEGQAIFVYENGEISGYKALSSNAITTDYGFVGNFSDYVVAQWGAIDLIVDQYTLASQGMIRLVVNSYWDGKPRRLTSFKAFNV